MMMIEQILEKLDEVMEDEALYVANALITPLTRLQRLHDLTRLHAALRKELALLADRLEGK